MPNNTIPLNNKCAHIGDRSCIFDSLLIAIPCGNLGLGNNGLLHSLIFNIYE